MSRPCEKFRVLHTFSKNLGFGNQILQTNAAVDTRPGIAELNLPYCELLSALL